MAGKKKTIKVKKVAKDVAVGVRVCCSNVVFQPTEKQKLEGKDKLLGKAKGVVLDFKMKSKKMDCETRRLQGECLATILQMTDDRPGFRGRRSAQQDKEPRRSCGQEEEPPFSCHHCRQQFEHDDTHSDGA